MSENELNIWHAALEKVPTKWLDDFVRFIEDGESTDEFALFFNNSTLCQDAFDLIMRADRTTRTLMDLVRDQDDGAREVAPDLVTVGKRNPQTC